MLRALSDPPWQTHLTIEMLCTTDGIVYNRWWFYLIVWMLPGVGDYRCKPPAWSPCSTYSSGPECHIQALPLHIDETSQVRKVILQNCMTLDLLTAVQGGTCSLLHIYLWPTDTGIRSLTGNVCGGFLNIGLVKLPHPWEYMGSTWHWFVINRAVVVIGLEVYARHEATFHHIGSFLVILLICPSWH